MGPVFDSRDKRYKDPFGAAPCSADIRFALEAKEDGSGNVTEYREMITPMEPGVLWVLPAIGESR